MTKEMDLLVHTLATYPEMNNPIKMEVGIEECLHIEFEYNKSMWENLILNLGDSVLLGWALFGKFWTIKKLFKPLKDIYPWITKLVSKWL